MKSQRKTYFYQAKMMIMRSLVALSLGVLCFLPYSAQAVTLKSRVTLENNVILLGDLFSGLIENNDRVLGAAPQPGQEMVLNARTLMRVAINMNVPWRPTSNADTVTITRAASIIEKDTIKDEIIGALQGKGIDGDLKIHIQDGANAIILPNDVSPTVEITQISMNPENGWFKATLAAPSAQNTLTTQTVSGKFDRMIDLPVLSETLRNGDIIGKNDISYIKVEERNLNHDTILDPKKLVGMTPRRIVTSARPLKDSDIQPPRLVERGETITMLFQSGGMMLSARGKAMENGSQGDLIRVVNVGSNRSVQGVVSGFNEVTVQ